MNKHIVLTLLLSATVYAAHANDFMKPNTEINRIGKHVVINIPQLRLFVYENGQLAKSYPVAVGKGRTQTPPGEYLIGTKAFNPTWHIPASIQRERAQKGLPAIKTIAPGPKNPLGPVFVRFGDPKLGLGIHGTSAPSSVPSFASHGCVRLRSDNALAFAQYIDTGSRVSVIYQQALLNTDDKHDIWLAVYKDPYNLKVLDALAIKTQALNLAQTHHKTINEKLLVQVLANKSGQLNCLSCAPSSNKVSGTLKPVAMTFKDPPPPPVLKVEPAPLPASAPITEPGDDGTDYLEPVVPAPSSHNSARPQSDAFIRLW